MENQAKLKNKKTICIVRYGPFSDDPRVYKEVKALIEAGFEVDVFCLEESGRAIIEKNESLRIHRINFSKKRRTKIFYLIQYLLFFLIVLQKLSLSYIRKRYSIVQINNVPNFLVFSAIVPKLFGARIILDMHEPMAELFSDQFGISKTNFWIWCLKAEEWLSIKFSNKVIFVSEMVADILGSRGHKGDKYIIIHNTPDETIFSQPAVEKVPNDQLIISCHSTMLGRYGIQVLIDAVPFLSDIKSLQVKLYGDGEYRQELERKVKDLGLTWRIKFEGRIPLEQLARELQNVDIGIVPLLRTSFTEIMAPNKLFEYVALRKPVVVSNLKGIRKYFPPDCVMYFEPGNPRSLADNVLTLYRDSSLKVALAERAYKHFEQFRWEKMKIKYLNLMTNCMEY